MQDSTPKHELQLQFGESNWRLNGRWDQLLHNASLEDASDLQSAVSESLRSPLDFPPMDQILVPGDRLALAVDAQIAQAKNVVSEVVHWFVHQGVSAENIDVVVGGSIESIRHELANELSEELPERVSVHWHDVNDSDQHSYLAANEAADPIYLNRVLVDADVVFPILAARPMGGLRSFGLFSSFAGFSDANTLRQFHDYDLLSNEDKKADLRLWAEEAVRWAGFMTSMQIVPGSQQSVSHVVAGMNHAVEERVQELMAEQWSVEQAEADLVLVALSGVTARTWGDFSDALYLAQKLAAPNASIAICTEIAHHANSAHSTVNEDSDERAPNAADDMPVSNMLSQVLEENHIYLASKLPAEVVEAMGMGVLNSANELEHLMGQFKRIVVVDGAASRGVVEEN